MIDIPTILAQLQQHYDAAVSALREDVIAFGKSGTLPPQRKREDGSYSYPQITLRYGGNGSPQDRSRAFGRLEMPGTYTTTITRPDLFASYLTEQLQLIATEYEIDVSIERSRQEIPFPYVLDGEAGAAMVGIAPQDIAQYFPSTDLALIGDELADGIEFDEAQDMPLSLFDGLRTDYSLARLEHYTGTEVNDFQDFILFTNYHRYVDEFVNWGAQPDRQETVTVALTGAAGLDIRESTLPGAGSTQRHRVAQAPDARLSPDPRGRARDHAGEYRRRPVQRQDDLRSPCRAAAPCMDDDRPLRRASFHPEDRRLRARPCLPAR